LKKSILLIVCIVLLFISGAKAQTIFSDGGKYGLMDSGNKIILPAQYDKITKHNKFDEYHLFILQQGSDYSFALKQFWETRKSGSYGFESTIDSIKWHFSEKYDTLYVLNEGLVDRMLPQFMTEQDSIKRLQQTRSWYSLVYRKNGKYGLINYEHKRKDVERIHKAGGLFGSDYDYWKGLYSFSNVTVCPAKYDDAIIFSLKNDKIPTVTQNNGKYGILRMGYNYEIPPQFDTLPIRLKEHFFCVKKNGMWGVIFLQEQDSVPLEIFPYQYDNIQQIEDNYKYLTFWVHGGYQYPACVYTTTENTVLQLKFIINRFYLGWGSVLSENELNNKIKNINFTPRINGKEIIQQKEYEYVVATNFEYSTDREKNATFFVIKLNKSDKSMYSNYYVDCSNFNNSYDERYGYVKKGGIKSILTYQLERDTFILLNEFNEEQGVNYNVVDKIWGWNFGCILKQTIIEKSNIYKYEFYTYEGEKIYEIISKYPIDDWEIIHNTPIMEFYTKIPPKKGSKKTESIKKVVCKYNLQKKVFL